MSEIIQFSKIKAYFMQNFIEFYRKYFPCCQKVVSGVWGLRTIFWANWGQKTYKSISPELWLPFLQTRPDFMQNFKLNKMFYLNIRIYLWLGVWGLKNSFGPIGPKRLTKPSVQHPSFNFHKQGLILSKIKRWIQWTSQMSKQTFTQGSGT